MPPRTRIPAPSLLRTPTRSPPTPAPAASPTFDPTSLRARFLPFAPGPGMSWNAALENYARLKKPDKELQQGVWLAHNDQTCVRFPPSPAACEAGRAATWGRWERFEAGKQARWTQRRTSRRSTDHALVASYSPRGLRGRRPPQGSSEAASRCASSKLTLQTDSLTIFDGFEKAKYHMLVLRASLSLLSSSFDDEPALTSATLPPTQLATLSPSPILQAAPSLVPPSSRSRPCSTARTRSRSSRRCARRERRSL